MNNNSSFLLPFWQKKSCMAAVLKTDAAHLTRMLVQVNPPLLHPARAS